MERSYNPRLHRFAVFTACWTFFLLLAGALVTSNEAGLSVPDWPLSYGSLFPPMVGGIFFEHGHRMVATVAGILTVILAVWISRRDSRAWMRRLGWVAVAGVIAQGLLGGLTVKFLLPVPVSVAHACLAQLFFCTVASLALFTGRWWLSDLTTVEDAGVPSVRTLCVLTLGAIFLQLILGATLRHKAIGVEPHIVGAGLVLVVASWTACAVWERFRHVPELRRAALLLSVALSAQFLLGTVAYWAVVVTNRAPQPLPLRVWTTAGHLALGGFSFAAATLLASRCFRVIQPGSLRRTISSREKAAA
jgi:cytochrome c oxidase assembly protein subunit 15